MIIGELRQEIGEEVCKELQKAVNEYQHLKKYWILVYTNMDIMMPGVIRTKIMVINKQKPPKMLGSMCFQVDNKKGKTDRLWVLPLDRPWDFEGDVINSVLLDAQGMPVIHG